MANLEQFHSNPQSAKMNLLLIVLAAILTTCSSTDLHGRIQVSDLPLTAKVTYEINEANLPRLVAYLLEYGYYNTLNTTQKFDVGLEQIFKEITFEELEEVLHSNNLTLSSLNVEHILTKLKIRPAKLCSLFFKSQEQMMMVLKVLGINGDDFKFALNLEDDKLMYDILRSGDYNQHTLNNLNISKAEIFHFLKPIIVEQLMTIDFDDYLDMIRPYKSMNLMKSFYEFHNVDLLKIGTIKDMIDSLKTALNDNKIVATAISKNTFIADSTVHKRWFTDETKDVLRLVVSNYTGGVFEVIASEVDSKYLNITVKNNVKFSALAQDYKKNLSSSCEFIMENMVMKPTRVINALDSIHILKADNLKYIAGAPLICHDRVYGIASEDGNSTIKFATFYDKSYTSSAIQVLSTITFIALMCFASILI